MFKRYLTPAEERQLLKYVGQFATRKARRDAAWMTVLLRTGMRIAEFASRDCAWARAALASGWVMVPREARKGRFRGLELPLTKTAREGLEQLLLSQRDYGGRNEDTEPLVLSREGGAMSVRAYQQALGAWAADCGLADKVTPHWLRHTFGMRIMRSSEAADPRMVAREALGHLSLESTAVYTGVTKESFMSALMATDTKRFTRNAARVVFGG